MASNSPEKNAYCVKDVIYQMVYRRQRLSRAAPACGHLWLGQTRSGSLTAPLMTGVGLTENDGHENDGPTLQGMKLQNLKLQEWNRRTKKYSANRDEVCSFLLLFS